MGLLFECSALHGKDNAISDVERGDGAFVPFIFPWFQYLLTIRNIISTRELMENIIDARKVCKISVSMAW